MNHRLAITGAAGYLGNHVVFLALGLELNHSQGSVQPQAAVVQPPDLLALDSSISGLQRLRSLLVSAGCEQADDNVYQCPDCPDVRYAGAVVSFAVCDVTPPLEAETMERLRNLLLSDDPPPNPLAGGHDSLRGLFREEWLEFLKDIDGVIHLAGVVSDRREYELMRMVNVFGTISLAAACVHVNSEQLGARDIQRFVFASSLMGLGRMPRLVTEALSDGSADLGAPKVDSETTSVLLTEEQTPVLSVTGDYSLPSSHAFAGSAYGESKFDAEVGVRRLFGQRERKGAATTAQADSTRAPELVVLYPGSLLGPVSPDPFAMSNWTRAFLRGFSAPLAPPGSVCVGDIRDVGKCFVVAATATRGALLHDRFHVTGHPISLLEMLSLIRGPFGDAPTRTASAALLCVAGMVSEGFSRAERWLTGGLRKGSFDAQTMWLLTQDAPVSSQRAEEELTFSARPLELTIRDTALWLRSEGHDVAEYGELTGDD